jgi:hypothetical protein
MLYRTGALEALAPQILRKGKLNMVMPEVPFRPIFITGFPRSGTTLVAAILDRHSSVTVTPETHFFETLQAVQDLISARYDMCFVYRLLHAPRMRDLSLNVADIYTLLSSPPITPQHIFQAVLTAYQRPRCKTRVGEKTPSHIMQADTLLNWYPQAKMIYVVRDGRDAISSLLKTPWRGHDILRLHAVSWRHSIQMARRMQHRFPDRFLCVQYEDIVSHTENEVRRIDQFCGIQYESRQLDMSILTETVPQWELPWKSRVFQHMDSGRCGQWRREFTLEEQWALNCTIGRSLKAFDYDDHSLSGCPIHRRLWLIATELLLRNGETRKVYRSIATYFRNRAWKPLPGRDNHVVEPSSEKAEKDGHFASTPAALRTPTATEIFDFVPKTNMETYKT